MPALPATATDALVRAAFTETTQADGYAIIATPQRLDFWFGNCLVLEREPEPENYGDWLARHAAAFAGKATRRRVIVWEVARKTAAASASSAYQHDVATVFAVRHVPSREVPFASIREFDRREDWDAAVALEVREARATAREEDFARWRFAAYPRDARAGRCRLWGAFAGSELLAFAGLYANDAYARFIPPVTQPAFRRRGLFAALCSVAVGETRRVHPAAAVVILAGRGEDAERIYLRLGFEPLGEQHALVAPVA